jgi:hypothetical protein
MRRQLDPAARTRRRQSQHRACVDGGGHPAIARRCNHDMGAVGHSRCCRLTREPCAFCGLTLNVAFPFAGIMSQDEDCESHEHDNGNADQGQHGGQGPPTIRPKLKRKLSGCEPGGSLRPTRPTACGTAGLFPRPDKLVRADILIQVSGFPLHSRRVRRGRDASHDHRKSSNQKGA